MALLVLIVEDDLGTQVATAEYLKRAGYGVITASNGREALRLLYEYHPQVVITDVIMPEMDGYSLVREIRQHPSLRLLPVVFLTARDTTPDRVRGYELGCDVYLPKPFELEELRAIVGNLLERSQVLQSELQFQRQSHSHSHSAFPSSPLPAYGSAVPEIAPPDVELTDREQDILALLSDGLSNNQIGGHLHLSPRTVEKYVSRLLRKTDTSNRAELVRFAVEHHLIKPQY
ncbi:MAG: response regulator transcription factor [Prochlorothrix sp.]|nr:response regulator transcription factor [Prochlorothrix sp.]